MSGTSQQLPRANGLYRREYDALITDRHHGAVAPLEPETCGCELPGYTFSDDSCWKCGKGPGPRSTHRTRGGTMTEDEPVNMTREQLSDRIEEL
ncbi:MAG: hypothetical protein M3Q53_05850, partial [Actinomycetota bacterium]|nr:hypothetical protein [Actinomycetota bacterium]